MNKKSKEIRKVPNLRFPGFHGEWREKRLGDIGSYLGGGTPDSSNQNFWNGDIPWISSSDISEESIFKISKTRFINKEAIINSAAKIVPKGTVLIVSRVGIGKFAVADEELCTSQDFTNLISKENDYFTAYYFKSKSKKFEKLSQGTSIKGFTTKDVKSIVFNFPTIKEQTKIASFLTKIEERIATQNKIIEDYKTLKKGLIQKIFKQELRFKDEDGQEFQEWEKQRLSEVLFEHKLKSTGNEVVHSVSVHKGVINQIEHLGRSFAAKNTDKYNRVLPNDIIYTKSPTGDFPLGIIKQSHLDDDVIVSPLYGVFTPDTKELGYILHAYFESNINTSNYLSSIIQKGAKNTINITNTTFLSKKLLLPISKQEQQKIASTLSAIDQKIALEEDYLDKLQAQKKYFLQNMFI